MVRHVVKVVLPPPIWGILLDEEERTGLSKSELLRQAYINHIKQHNLYTELVHRSPREGHQP